MFYKSTKDPELRFGDVLEGYVLASTSISGPKPRDYKIEIKYPDFCVIITPCCNIENGMILLSPLIHILSDFLKNEYFKEDFTRINRKMEPKYKFSKGEWGGFTPEKKLDIESKGKYQWSNINYFIYDKHETFTEYPLRKENIGHYMIDFRRTYRLKCPMIKRKKEMKPDDNPIIESKRLQLSDTIREELRTKLSFFYFRNPDNDIQ